MGLCLAEDRERPVSRQLIIGLWHSRFRVPVETVSVGKAKHEAAVHPLGYES